MKNALRTALFYGVVIFTLLACRSVQADDATTQAGGVITRTFGNGALDHVKLETLPAESDRDVFEFSAQGGELNIRGSSAVAIASGFYQFVRQHELGIASWTGNRLDRSSPWPNTPVTRVATPYALRYYWNVVTFGYTTPYWTWDRWEKEIDWMALHGINMPLSPVGTEAIGTRVWKKLGLTQNEIDPFYTGPAHLPWQRMGNISKLDGPLSDAWNDDQIALQHQILDRERQLGMHPIGPAFAGFVPRALQRIYPDAKLTEFGWNGFAPEYKNHILSPTEPCFLDIGKLQVQEWEKEFGKCEYFLADSFNEMRLPTKTADETNALLEKYGDIVYRSIAAGDPDATWVLQGWIFINDPGTWTHDAFRSLLKNVPDDRMLILDEAIDYSAQPNGGRKTFQKYDGYFNKRWIAGYIPNMGGTTSDTGKLDFYARGVADCMASPGHGRLSGIGIVPEGIENNEVIYELIADTIWHDTPIDLSEWMKNYARSRYGPGTPASVDAAMETLHRGPYSKLIDHPHFSWQLSPGPGRQTADDAAYIPALEQLLAAAPQLKDAPLYQADVTELAAFAAGGYAERLLNQAIQLGELNDPAARRATADRALSLLNQIDQALSRHPTDRLDRWVNFARSHGTTPAEKDRYEANAKLLVTLWGKNGEISDYSERVWSGLIAGYYVPRWRSYFDSLEGVKTDRRAFEASWWQTPLKPVAPSSIDEIAAAEALLDACHQPLPISLQEVAKWTPPDMSTDWKTMDWPIHGTDLEPTTSIEFRYTSGACRLDIQSVKLLDGQEVLVTETHPGSTGQTNKNNRYLLKIPHGIDSGHAYTLRASVRTDGGTDSHGTIYVLEKAKN